MSCLVVDGNVLEGLVETHMGIIQLWVRLDTAQSKRIVDAKFEQRRILGKKAACGINSGLPRSRVLRI